MVKVPVYVTHGSTATRVVLFTDENRAKDAMWATSAEPKKEWLVYDEFTGDIAKASFAYKAYNGEYTDWYLTEREAMMACAGKMPYVFYEAIIK